MSLGEDRGRGSGGAGEIDGPVGDQARHRAVRRHCVGGRGRSRGVADDVAGHRVRALVVTSSGDAGVGTLRDAIQRADAAEVRAAIAFDLRRGSRIVTKTDLPPITAPVTIDGQSTVTLHGNGRGIGLVVAADNVVVRGLTITGFAIGVEIQNANHSTIAANTILDNQRDGVRVVGRSNDNTIGGTTSTDGNAIVANGGSGIAILGPSRRDVAALLKNRAGAIDLQTFIAAVPFRNRVVGNAIGASEKGVTRPGNRGAGVAIEGTNDTSVGGTQPGAANVIANNGGAGVSITRTSRTVVHANSISANAGGAIVRVDAGKSTSDAPTVTRLAARRSAQRVTVSGRVHGDKNAQLTLEIFTDDRCTAQYRWAQRHAGRAKVTLDGKGDGAFSMTLADAMSGGSPPRPPGARRRRSRPVARVPATPVTPTKTRRIPSEARAGAQADPNADTLQRPRDGSRSRGPAEGRPSCGRGGVGGRRVHDQLGRRRR